MLNIKLPLVDLVAAENICHLFQVVQLRDTSAGAVLIIASVGKIGLCDLIARSLFAPTELSISSVTAVFGAPVVIWLLVRRNSEREGA